MSIPQGYSLPDFIEEEFKTPMFVVDRIVPFGSKPGLIIGKRGAGKSHLVNNLLMCVADGLPLLDEFACMQGKVCYLSVDMPYQAVQNRLRKLSQNIVNQDNIHVEISDTSIDIMRTKPDAAWVQRILRFEPLLLIIDTLRNIHRMDENDNSVAATVYDRLETLFGGHQMAKCVAHHEHKESKDAGGRPEEERSSGAGAWVDIGNFVLRVKKNAKKKPAEVNVSFPRVRFAAEQPSILTYMCPDSMMLKVRVTPQTRAIQLTTRYPEWDHTQVAQCLLAEGLCKHSRAYEIAEKIWNMYH